MNGSYGHVQGIAFHCGAWHYFMRYKQLGKVQHLGRQLQRLQPSNHGKGLGTVGKLRCSQFADDFRRNV